MSPPLDPIELETCLRVLQQVSEDTSLVDHHERFKGLIAKIHRDGTKGARRKLRAERQEQWREQTLATGLVRQQLGHPAELQLADTRPESGGEKSPSAFSWRCYICKQPYADLDPFYHRLCPACASENLAKRTQSADLRGRIALLTGGRIKIGYQLALRLLRDGARLILTTRFPRDAAERLLAEPDAVDWAERLEIYGLDLRHIPSVEQFLEQMLQSLPHLDIIINNAAQTVKRPREFYAHLLEKEATPPALTAGPVTPGAIIRRNSQLLELAPGYAHGTIAADLFPMGTLDLDGQQVDLRANNSWKLRLDEVSTLELLEVHLVNTVAPYLFNARLKPLLLRSPHERRFIVNVSAMEGQFNRVDKTVFHPHTNMAKAALNMMTRTAAADYARDDIYMNSVDTGWITDENPHPIKERMRDHHGFYAPLDAVDGMARVYDPIATGLNTEAEPLFGHFLKDYRPYAW